MFKPGLALTGFQTTRVMKLNTFEMFKNTSKKFNNRYVHLLVDAKLVTCGRKEKRYKHFKHTGLTPLSSFA